MIVSEIINIEGLGARRKNYSDTGHIIRKVGTNEEYSEALDLISSSYIYEETDKLIEVQNVNE